MNSAANSEEIAGLKRALDRAYDRIRTKAGVAWEKQKPAADPADRCVSVRVRKTSKRQARS